MKKKIKTNTNNNYLVNSLLIILSSFFIVSPSNAQIISNKCELDGKLFYSNCTKYFGDCQDNKANGWGNLYFDNNKYLRGLFINNKLQNRYIEYYSSVDKPFHISVYFDKPVNIIFGPNRDTALHGPCVSITEDGRVELLEIENGLYRRVSNIFKIPQPKSYLHELSAANLRSKAILIPNTNFVIFELASEYNSRGDFKYWLNVFDLASNKIIQNFGSSQKPLTFNYEPNFIGFTNKNKPIYKFLDKYYKLEISSGISIPLNSIPEEIKFLETVKKISYKDLGTLKSNGEPGKFDKFKILSDSSYVKIFNNKLYLKNVSNLNFDRQDNVSGSSLVMFNKKHEIIKSLDLPNYNILDFDIDEKSGKVALSYVKKDSIYLSYYDLKTFNYISNIYKKIGILPGTVKFSKTGIYLLYDNYNGTLIFLGNKLYFGIPGSVFDINNDDNVIISYNDNDRSIYAFDLENKIIIWKYFIGAESYGLTPSFTIEDKMYIWHSVLGSEGDKLFSFSMPKPLLSITEFLKKPQETVTMLNTEKDKILLNKNNLSDQTESEIKKSDDDLFRSYLALLFLSAIFESSNNQNNSNSSGSDNYSSSSGTKPQCNYCKGTGNCSLCSKVYQVRYYDFKKKEWKTQNETRKGYVMCSRCYGSGLIYKMDAGNTVVEDECYVSSCNDGWHTCDQCNSLGNGRNIGSCKYCRGTGSRN